MFSGHRQTKAPAPEIPRISDRIIDNLKSRSMQDDIEAVGERTRKDIDDGIIRLVERFKSKAKSANRMALILITLLITFWLSGLEPRTDAITTYLGVSKLRAVAVKKARLINEANSAPSAIVQQEIVPIPQSGDKASVSAVRDTDSQGEIYQRQSPKQLKKSLDEIESKKVVLKELELEAKKQARFPYEFPGGLKASIPIETAPVLWLALSFFGLAYLLWQRSGLLHLGSRIARNMIEAPQQAAHFQEMLDDAPWWLAPIPYKRGELVSRQELKTIFGWRNDLPFSAMTCTCYVLLIFAQAKVLFLTYLFVNLEDQSRYEWIDWVAPTVASMFVLSSIAMLATVYCQAEMPDRLPSYNTVVSLPRRRLLYFAVLGTGGALFGGFLNHRIDQDLIVRDYVARSSSQYSPRFRRRSIERSKQQLSKSMNGLYENMKSGKVHYVSKGGIIYSPPSVNEANLNAISDISETASSKNLEGSMSKLATNRLAWAAESYALSLVERNKVDRALQSLRLAIRTAYSKRCGQNAIRLSDLLAGLAVRYKRNDFLSQLTSDDKFVCTDFLADEAVKARLQKWTNTKSKWFQKWAKDSTVLPWKRGTLLA
jgi:hypothetical protein